MSTTPQRRPLLCLALATLLGGSATALVHERDGAMGSDGAADPPAPQARSVKGAGASCSGADDDCGRPFTLRLVDPGMAGLPNDFRVEGATPGDQVVYFLGRPTGTSEVDVLGCPRLTLDIALARSLGKVVADDDGEATLGRPIPIVFAGLALSTQAVDVANCTVSNEQTATY